ncbi:hypothetical protein [Bradyrhizobium sp. LB11.1]|uniref:hypothetical protein n=1 Tax=Bradyrhizobium sp. LB11.1 TaxID=3156326 RepID=UPI0033920ADC
MTKAKLAKTDVKRSAPVQGAAAPPISLGSEMLKHLHRAVGTERFLAERGCPSRAGRATLAASDMADTLASFPPHAPAEALAAAILIYTDLDSVVSATTDFIRDAAQLRIQQRVAGLAAWIESAHGIDRRNWGLDYFGDHNLVGTARLMPHTEITLIANPDCDN